MQKREQTKCRTLPHIFEIGRLDFLLNIFFIYAFNIYLFFINVLSTIDFSITAHWKSALTRSLFRLPLTFTKSVELTLFLLKIPKVALEILNWGSSESDPAESLEQFRRP